MTYTDRHTNGTLLISNQITTMRWIISQVYAVETYHKRALYDRCIEWPYICFEEHKGVMNTMTDMLLAKCAPIGLRQTVKSAEILEAKGRDICLFDIWNSKRNFILKVNKIYLVYVPRIYKYKYYALLDVNLANIIESYLQHLIDIPSRVSIMCIGFNVSITEVHFW